MKIRLCIGDREYTADTDGAVSLARPLDFASTVTDFSAPPPHREPVQIGDFVGDTRQGGSCNVDQLSLIPHCHGTHTETVGHIVDEPITIADAQLPPLMICVLMTVTPQLGEQTDEPYEPQPADSDLLITMTALKTALRGIWLQHGEGVVLPDLSERTEALVVRCRSSAVSALPPYFSTAAIHWLHESGVKHLLVESPSIDRLEDGGTLTNHHAYWNVPAGAHALPADSWIQKTITESIAVPSDITDGVYLLNLQVSRFVGDAAPSQPVIMPLQLASGDATEVPR